MHAADPAAVAPAVAAPVAATAAAVLHVLAVPVHAAHLVARASDMIL